MLFCIHTVLIIGFEASEYQADEDAGTFSSVSICVRANNSLSLDPQLAPSFTVEAQNGTANGKLAVFITVFHHIFMYTL